MGINLRGSPNFDRITYNILSASQSTIALTEQDFITALANMLSELWKETVEITKTNNTYNVEVKELSENENWRNYLPTSSPVENFSLTGEGSEQEVETEDYLWIYYPLIYSHKSSGDSTTKVIYYRGRCITLVRETDSSGDGYVGPENIRILFTFRKELKKDEPVPIVPTTFGAFPSGIGADYSILVCKTDFAYANNLEVEDLNKKANDYIQKINSSLSEANYYGLDNKGKFIYVEKEFIDNSNEVKTDWESLWTDDIFEIENEVVTCEIDGEEKECYKIYLVGKCQLLDLDGESLIIDQGGSTELGSYYFPNGYYILVGKQLRLFMLTDLNAAEWPYDDSENKVNLPSGSSLTSGVRNLTSRQTYSNNNYYLYKGHRTFYVSSVSTDSIILSEISNLRKVVVSDTVTSIGHFGGQANPDNGFYISDNLEYVGPLTITYTAGTKVFIKSTNVKEIADNAFYNSEYGTSTNLSLYLCDDPQAASQIEKLSRGYVAPSSVIEKIGEHAFYGIPVNAINLTNCSNLNYIGKEAFAVNNLCKDFYYLISQLSQRDDVENKNLIYLPDEIDYNAVAGSDLRADYSNYTDEDHRTFGTSIGGYTMHPRNGVININSV